MRAHENIQIRGCLLCHLLSLLGTIPDLDLLLWTRPKRGIRDDADRIDASSFAVHVL